MSFGLVSPDLPPAASRWPRFTCPWRPPEPLTAGELRNGLWAGDNAPNDVEHLLVLTSRAAGALEVAMGEGLAALRVGDRLVSLGFSNLGDFAREVLGIGERKALAMAHLAEGLRSRPLLRAAVCAGEVRIRSAEVVLPVARGEAEGRWVELAKAETVRALEDRVRREHEGLCEEDDSWSVLRVGLAEDERAEVDLALSLAEQLDASLTRAQRLEALAQEYLGGYPDLLDENRPPLVPCLRTDPQRARTHEARLEAETLRWDALPAIPGWTAPDAGFDGLTTGREIYGRLIELDDLRKAWDALLGYAAWTVKASGIWKVVGFASFAHYCAERLGLGARTVEQRAWVEKRLWQLPALLSARDAGLEYEKVRMLANLPDREIDSWLATAWELPAITLRRRLTERGDTQMRAARELRVAVPCGVASVLEDAIRTARVVAGNEFLPDGKALVLIARHFVDAYGHLLDRRRTPSERIRARDAGSCQAPGCRRRATHVHHVVFQSRGGDDDPENLVSLCTVHHLRCIHDGHMRVTGRAPDSLAWVSVLR